TISNAGPGSSTPQSPAQAPLPIAERVEPHSGTRGRLFASETSTRAPAWPFYAGLGALLVAGLVSVLKRPARLERDSPAFARALDLWFPVVREANPTPRSIKRFLNRVRYYAMCQRPDEVHDARGKVSRTSAMAIPEGILVALGAIQHLRAEWLNEDALWKSLYSFVLAKGAELPPAFKARQSELQLIGSLEPYREHFMSMARGIRITH